MYHVRLTCTTLRPRQYPRPPLCRGSCWRCVRGSGFAEQLRFWAGHATPPATVAFASYLLRRGCACARLRMNCALPAARCAPQRAPPDTRHTWPGFRSLARAPARAAEPPWPARLCRCGVPASRSLQRARRADTVAACSAARCALETLGEAKWRRTEQAQGRGPSLCCVRRRRALGGRAPAGRAPLSHRAAQAQGRTRRAHRERGGGCETPRPSSVVSTVVFCGR